jgi:hypothetical protein
MLRLLFAACLPALCLAADPGRMVSLQSKSDFLLTADPSAPQWRGVKGVLAGSSASGEPVPNHQTNVRSRWTSDNLYFLFTCGYDQLYLNSNPSTTTETNKLWDHDVAEVFIGWDPNNIARYKEFEVSPQGEWVDLDIDRKKALPEGGWRWDSGFKVKSRIDEAKKIWYAEMQIPWKSIDERPVKPGNELRINLYRSQGPPPKRIGIAWQPTGPGSYHKPEKFGILQLAK